MCLFIIFRYLLRTDELPQSQGRKSYREKAKNNVQILNEQNESAPKEKGKTHKPFFSPTHSVSLIFTGSGPLVEDGDIY